METLEEMKEQNLLKLEKTFQIKFEEAQKSYNDKLQEISTMNELKIRDLKMDNEVIRKEKDREIFRLSEIIQQQCSRLNRF